MLAYEDSNYARCYIFIQFFKYYGSTVDHVNPTSTALRPSVTLAKLELVLALGQGL
jgi:hypothetical protein